MSEAKKKVLAKIAKKQKLNKSYKDKAARRLGPNGIVLQFIEAMEKILTESKGHLEFSAGLESEANILHDRFRALDPGVSIKINWNNEASTEDWRNLQVEGVSIYWSKWHRGKNPFNDPERHITVTSLFMDGLLTEEEEKTEST